MAILETHMYHRGSKRKELLAIIVIPFLISAKVKAALNSITYSFNVGPPRFLHPVGG